jgi:hypothetical protein
VKVKINESRRQQTPQPSSSANVSSRKISSKTPAVEVPSATTASGKIETYLLRVHLYSTIEVKQTTIMKVLSNTMLSEVFEQICEKRKYRSEDYVLRMADTKTDVPLDKTLEQLGVKEFCVLKRDRGGAGDIFLRPPDESDAKDDLPRFLSADEYSVYKVCHPAPQPSNTLSCTNISWAATTVSSSLTATTSTSSRSTRKCWI